MDALLPASCQGKVRPARYLQVPAMACTAGCNGGPSQASAERQSVGLDLLRIENHGKIDGNRT